MFQLKGNRIAAYARFSSDRQSESSIEDQLRKVSKALAPTGHELSDDLIFTDYALSAASAQRPDYERLMAAVRRREIDVLIVESTSRLSRDNADSWTAWKEFEYYGVQLIGLDDGIDSTRPGAKMSFGFKSLINSDYLDTLGKTTLRGMEGAAHQDHSTGGTPYGYRTVAIPGPDPRRPLGFRVEKHPDEMAIVLRIFEAYVGGASFADIAKGLNRDGVPSPRAGSRHKRGGGWVGGSIRVILYNEKYAGVWRFNERRWVKVPGTNKRRPVMKDARDVVTKVYEERRIVPEELWERVQERLRRVHDLFTKNADGSPKGRAAAGGSAKYPLSSLLLCGVCGAPMVIHGSVKQYKCGDFANRGTCSNGVFVKEHVVRARLFEAIRERVASSEAVDYLRKKYAAWLGERERTRGGELAAVRERLARTEQRLRNVSMELADGNRTDAMRTLQSDLEATAKAERRHLKALEETAAQPVRLPSRDEVLRAVVDLEARVAEDPVAAREALRRMLGADGIRLHPQPDGTYRAEARFYVFELGRQKENRPPGGIREGGNLSSSGGTVRHYPDHWVPFSGRIPINPEVAA